MAKQSVLVGMSGGVDSSLTAALLLEQGYAVTGVFLKVWSEADLLLPWQGRGCPWEQDLADARLVAQQLGIELLVKNVQREYWERVVADFLAGYQAGQTPNPDVLCNSQIKFGLLYDWALEEGYEFIATGHYARTQKHENDQFPMNNFQLHRGTDPVKDQTYFLWRLDPQRLAHILFPIGHLTKNQVRIEATKRGLTTAQKKDSQGICFLGPLKVRQWLAETLKTQPGEVLALDGTVIGTHNGAHLYTLGQRHGFTIDRATRYELRGTKTDRPAHFVVKRDVAENQLTVSPNPPKQRELHAQQLNWLSQPPKAGDHLEARIRHGQAPQPAQIIEVTAQQLLLEFHQPQLGIAPGQSVVLTLGSLVLGGGLIA